jgi:hypothetical protein
MFGQFLLEPEEVEPDELLDGLELLDDVPEELEVEAEPEPVVAALATSAPPVTRPAVSAPKATALRRCSFMVACPFHGALSDEGTPSLCDLDLWIGP